MYKRQFSHKSITSSSLKPIYGVNGPALSIVNWVKLFKADWVFNFFIGKIPVRYASAIYFDAVSYTHLDVYKRQQMYGFRPALSAAFLNVASCIRGEHEQTTTPVRFFSLMAS